ncbi:MAG: HAD-IC family P-type ATPase [Eubacteriales bacterium]|nr:HAD-IC family P-type ATPase [Eubacteriales bacterium]
MKDWNFYGLSSAEVEDRVRMERTNKTENSVSKSRKEIVREHSLTYFNFLNLFLGILVAATGQFKNMMFLGVVVVNTAIGIIQEFRVKKLIDQISVMNATKAVVIREGKQQEIAADEVVMDDILLIQNGDQICADCRVLESDGLEVNESMLTGESKPVKKKAQDKLMSGSFAVSGSAVGKVYHIGEENYAAALSRKAKIKKRASSQMQATIRRIIKIDGAILVPVGLLLYYSQQQIEGMTNSGAIVNTVAGVIGMIPEGLVLLTSVSFVLGVGRLASKRALVQEMEAIEALARVDALCLDKTGTITTGDLDVKEIVPLQEKSQEELSKLMSELTWAFEDINSTQSALRSYFAKSAEWQVKEKIPFSSERKYRAICFEEQGGFALGAPEMLFPENVELQEKVNGYSDQGYRVLLLCSAEFTKIENKEEASKEETEEKTEIEAPAEKIEVAEIEAPVENEEKKMTPCEPLALIVISDQIRPEAPEVFDFFKKRSVSIKVLSGDHPATVSNIAKKAGVDGAEKYIDARKLPEEFEELRTVVDEYTVFGRVRPEQKQSIIRALRSNGKVAGMVGDGVNDVLALKDADCGIAMAAGSDAAKQVAHIVLLDSDFSSMKAIVSEGRTIIGNIERVSALYLTKTIYSILLCVLFIFLQKSYPFIPIQLSWISTTMIGIPSFLLTLEKNEDGVSHGFLRQVLGISLPAAVTLVLTILVTQGLSPFWTEELKQTSSYNMMLGGAVGLLVVCRVCRPMTRRHRQLCEGLAVLFAGGILLLPDFYSVYPLFRWQNLLILPMICMVLVSNEVLRRCMEKTEEKTKKLPEEYPWLKKILRAVKLSK